MNDPARFELEVRFYELDPYGHVNHATYLQYFEAARARWLNDMGQGLDLLQDAGCNLVVTTVACRFISPALLGEMLTIETGLVDAKRVTAQWAQIARRGDDLVAAQRINFATVNPAGRPMRCPASLAEAMADFRLPEGWHERELPELSL
ncbi:MAG: thioesterase family protein [Actinomycetota bacterium]